MSAPPSLYALHGQRSTLVLEVRPDAAPTWRYWGARLPDAGLPTWPLADERSLPPSTLDRDPVLSVCPGWGFGWFAPSALLAHRHGQDFAQQFERCEAVWLREGRALQFRLSDPTARLSVVIDLTLDPASDVLSLQTCLHNDGDAPLDLQWLAAGTLPLPDHADRIRSYTGQYAQEFQPQDECLGRSTWRRENRRGRTSHDCFPGALAHSATTTDDQGPVWAAHLAWSGNHQQSIDALTDGRRQWQWGEWLAPGEARLAPGASWTTPVLLACYSPLGFNGAAACWHAEARRRLAWPGGVAPPRPVHLNTWEALYFDVQPAAVMALAERAAEVGVERFVLDDGWFHGRHDDKAGLGDWWPDARRFPDGLGPVAAHVRELGMEFGLWVEPEMVSPDSELNRQHPDWALQLAGRAPLTGRNQLVLDLTHPGVTDYLFERLHQLLSGLPIGYLKWDHNRELATAGDRAGQAVYHRQVEALYALLARLRAAHPSVEIESCAAGGGRIDFGILPHVQRFWVSDNNDALSRLSLQRGFLQFFPPEVMGAHIGAAVAHTTGRQQRLGFRAAVALPGHLGIEADLSRLSAAERQALAEWVRLYKTLRPRLHRGQVWCGTAADGLLWQLHGEAGGADWLLVVARAQPSTLKYPPPLCLPMLAADASYRLSLCNSDVSTAAPAYLADPIPPMPGAWLAQHGLPLPPQQAESVLIFQLQRLP